MIYFANTTNKPIHTHTHPDKNVVALFADPYNNNGFLLVQISAQESRRKKKEYVECLEKK